MTNLGHTPPDHLIITSKKMKPEWYKNTLNYYVGLAISYKDIAELDRQRRAFGGSLDSSDYHFVLNPYNFTEDRFANLPGRLRNYDIIQPVWRRYMGEYSKSTHNFTVIGVNPEVENQFENGLMEMVNGKVRQLAANALNAEGIDSGIKSKDVSNVDDAVRSHKATYKQTRAMLANERLDILNHTTGDETIRLRCYSDWINYSEFYTVRDVRHDDVYKEAVPVEEYYAIDNGKEFVEDNDAGVRIRQMTIPQILEYFGTDLTKTEYNYLRDLSLQYAKGIYTVKGSLIYNPNNVEIDGQSKSGLDPLKDYKFCDSQGYLDVIHTVYKTQIPTRILTFINPLGEELQTEVTDSYKIDPSIGDIGIEIVYRNRVWGQYRLGEEASGVYMKPKEIDVQRTDINNNNICKLPYNGRRRLFPGFPSHGILKTLMPYQIFINILYLTRERAIAKNHGKIMTIPQSFINSNGNLEDEEKIYYMLADGKLYVDDTGPNFANAIQGLKSVETGDGDYILGLGALIQETKLSAQEDVDMNRQRFGETAPSDGKYTTQQALIRSSLGSAIINDLFAKTFEKDYDADMDYSKVAWINGKKGTYLNSDRQVAFFDINGTEHAETSFGIFATGGQVEQEKIDQLKEFAFSAGQNGDLLIAAQAVNLNDSGKLQEHIEKYDQLVQTRNENAAKSEQESNQAVEQIKQQNEQAKIESAENIAKFNGQIKLKIKELDILETELKISSAEDIAGVKAQIEDKKAELQSFIQTSAEAVEKDQAMLGLV